MKNRIFVHCKFIECQYHSGSIYCTRTRIYIGKGCLCYSPKRPTARVKDKFSSGKSSCRASLCATVQGGAEICNCGAIFEDMHKSFCNLLHCPKSLAVQAPVSPVAVQQAGNTECSLCGGKVGSFALLAGKQRYCEACATKQFKEIEKRLKKCQTRKNGNRTNNCNKF